MASSCRGALCRLGLLLGCLLVAVAALNVSSNPAWAVSSLDEIAKESVQIESTTITAPFFQEQARGSSDDAVVLPRICPTIVESSCTPQTVEAGISCGMADMCGLEPCLCGKSDAWGSCACNGMETLSPQVTYASSDPNVVEVCTFMGKTFLVPHSDGEATITCTGSVRHYLDGEAVVKVKVDGFNGIDIVHLVLVLIVIDFVATWVYFGRRALKRRRQKGEQ